MAQPTLYDKLRGTPALAMLEMNHELADKMMAVFRRILLSCKKKGVDPKQLEHVTFGSTHPIAPNTTADGRQKNRRVDFEITKQ